MFLLDNNCGDLILNDTRAKNAKDRIYASDIMMKFLESERGQNDDTSEWQLTIPDVVGQSEQLKCHHQYMNAGTLQGDAMKKCLKCGDYVKTL